MLSAPGGAESAFGVEHDYKAAISANGLFAIPLPSIILAFPKKDALTPRDLFQPKNTNLAYDAEYIQGKDKYDARIWGAGLTAGVTEDIDIFGDYYQNTDYKGDPQTWTAGLAFGHYNMKKFGTFRIAGQYISAEKGSFLNDTTYTASAAGLVEDRNDINRPRFWLASADLVLMKNVRLHGEYAFDVKTNGKAKTNYDDLATVSLNYVF